MKKRNYRIKNIKGYFKRIEDIKENGENIGGVSFTLSNMFFRGQANSNWKLIPSVFRDNLISKEIDIIAHAERRCWSSLQNDQTELEMLIRLQHYGLATRLLDLTSNSLVALYFAVCSDDDKDGKVFVFQCPEPQHDDFDTAKLIAKICRNKNFDSMADKNKICSWLKDMGIHQDKYNHIIDYLYEPIFFNAPLNNDRIKNQRGAFIIGPLFDKNQRDNDIHKYKTEISYDKNNCGLLKDEIIINKKYKRNIRNELIGLGIDASIIFPDFEHSLLAINTMFKDK